MPESALASAVGSVCTVDPSCKIVGRTHMLVWQSRSPKKIVVVCIHGLGLCARAYKPLAEELSCAGIDGFAVNVRGFGPDRQLPGRSKLDCAKTVEDVCTLLTGVRKEHPEYKIVLIGESMGGALAIRIAAEHAELIDKLVCSAPAWRILKLDRTAVKGVVEITFFSHRRPGPAGRSVMRQATSNSALAQHWLSDPAHKLKLSPGEAAAFLKFIAKTDGFARHLIKPTLVIEGLNDHLVSPQAVARLYRDIPASQKAFLIDAQGEHLVLEEGQYTPFVLKKLLDWIENDRAESASGSQEIEVVNDVDLTTGARHRLSLLEQAAGQNKE